MKSRYFTPLYILALAAVLGTTGCGNAVMNHAMHESSNGEPVNYVKYDAAFASAGMPDAAFIKTLANQGVDVVINIAPSESRGSLESEGALVEAANMSYLNISVDWNSPGQDDVDQFLAYMQAHADDHVFLHCQMNMRATAFAMLHRVINLGVDPQVAERDMHHIWTPNQTWAGLINTALARNDVDYQVSVQSE